MTMQTNLLAWYRENARKLSFRKNRDPYRIWISEIMAQQTRIEAMLPYFERFIELYPNIPALAAANDEQLHKAWEGLGYYSRCRNLKKCAQVCVEQYDGKLPVTKKQLARLPGIGDYTSGAIASIAYGEKVSAIDGNVSRVFARLYDIRLDITKAAGKKRISELVEDSLVDPIQDYNQALMELGAAICTPRSPKCTICPVQAYCKTKDPESLPVKPKKKARKVEIKQIYVLTDGKKIHMNKRSDTGLLANMYEFDETIPDPDAIEKKIDLGEYTHIFSHVEWRMSAQLFYVREGKNFYDIDTIENELAVPSAFLPFFEKAKEKLEQEED
ncbi:A/G-specific adenine glycosylase [Firmicutes bacterium M10-2]|nr:A/G-specific adenine glycosylase [Firmicutes bacterium M10-2]